MHFPGEGKCGVVTCEAVSYCTGMITCENGVEDTFKIHKNGGNSLARLANRITQLYPFSALGSGGRR